MGVAIVILVIAIGAGLGITYLVFADRTDYTVKKPTPPRPDPH